jgi:hypothetical protein
MQLCVCMCALLAAGPLDGSPKMQVFRVAMFSIHLVGHCFWQLVHSTDRSARSGQWCAPLCENFQLGSRGLSVCTCAFLVAGPLDGSPKMHETFSMFVNRSVDESSWQLVHETDRPRLSPLQRATPCTSVLPHISLSVIRLASAFPLQNCSWLLVHSTDRPRRSFPWARAALSVHLLIVGS